MEDRTRKCVTFHERMNRYSRRLFDDPIKGFRVVTVPSPHGWLSKGINPCVFVSSRIFVCKRFSLRTHSVLLKHFQKPYLELISGGYRGARASARGSLRSFRPPFICGLAHKHVLVSRTCLCARSLTLRAHNPFSDFPSLFTQAAFSATTFSRSGAVSISSLSAASRSATLAGL